MRKMWSRVKEPFPIFSSKSLIPPAKYTTIEKRNPIHKNKIKKGKFSTTCGNLGKKVVNSRNRLTRKSTS